MKKFSALILLSLISVLLVACGTEENVTILNETEFTQNDIDYKIIIEENEKKETKFIVTFKNKTDEKMKMSFTDIPAKFKLNSVYYPFGMPSDLLEVELEPKKEKEFIIFIDDQSKKIDDEIEVLFSFKLNDKNIKFTKKINLLEK